ncbi:MAG: CopG family ribbon-helix-helix protein [Candidatus Saccharimonadales bacterium]
MATTQGIKLDDNTRARLKALAEKKQHSPHWLMRNAIEKYIEHEEKYENEKAEDNARWEQYLITSRAVDNEEVEAWLKNLSHGKPHKWQG